MAGVYTKRREYAHLVAAMHPVNAMLVFGLAVMHAVRSSSLLEERPAGARVGAM